MAGLLAGASPAAALVLVETPALAQQVASGRLPGIAERVPANPLVVSLGGETRIGRHGGDLKLLTRVRDPQAIPRIGYTRLVAYNAAFELVPDLLESLTVEEGRSFVLRLRPGHKWSDGRPFTAEDFRYWWEDVANNPALSPGGLPRALLVDGEPPRFTVLNATTVRYVWSRPNPDFLPALAAGQPLTIFRPAHYLRQFHVRHADQQALARSVQANGATDWAVLHSRRDTTDNAANPEMPALTPWVNTTLSPADGFIAIRNPYYHRVDAEGRQLPYIDRILLTRPPGEQLLRAAQAGESHLQIVGLSWSDLDALEQAASRLPLDLRLWRGGRGSYLALYPNLQAADPVWRTLNRDLRFRRALSIAIDRLGIADRLFGGRAAGGNNVVLPASPLYRAEDRAAWAEHDPAGADALLDDIGLRERDARGIRRLPDGRPMELPIAFADGDAFTSEILEAMHEDMARVGIWLVLRPTPRDALRRRVQAGEIVVTAAAGLSNGLANADISPGELVPADDRQNNWPGWGRFIETGGRQGEAPEDAAAQRLVSLMRAWRGAVGGDARSAAWRGILEISGEQLFSIGTVAELPMPVLVHRALQNVPVHAYLMPDLGLQLGLFRPEQFWFDPPP